MKTKLLIAAMCAWLALPHSQSAAEIKVIQSGCQKCGGDIHYDGESEGECSVCHEKLALVLLMIGGCIAVGAAGCYTIKKLKKLNGVNGPINPTNRFGTNLFSALNSTNAMPVVQMDREDVPYLLSLATAQDSSGRFVLEQSTDLQTWTELGRYADENFLAVHSADAASCFYRLRVGP